MAEKVEHVHCSECGKRVSGVDPELGLVVRAYVECPECIERAERCINCGRRFVLDEMRYSFGYQQVGPFCEYCDRTIKVHTKFQPEIDRSAAETTEPTRRADQQIGEFTLRICRGCFDLKGEMCHNAECIFCRRTMAEVGDVLDMLLIRPLVDGKRITAQPFDLLALPVNAAEGE